MLPQSGPDRYRKTGQLFVDRLNRIPVEFPDHIRHKSLGIAGSEAPKRQLCIAGKPCCRMLVEDAEKSGRVRLPSDMHIGLEFGKKITLQQS